MNTVEGNKLIALFLGWEAEYHKSWDALMPVVEKIEELSWKFAGDDVRSHSFSITRTHVCITGYTGVGQDFLFYQTPYGKSPETKIQAVWDAVTHFINEYNQNK